MNCPCGNKKHYNECCGLIHEDIASAKSPEAIMRSRYTAFTQANGDYLMRSQHSSTRRIDQKYDLIKWAMSVKWLRLEVIEVSDFNENEGFVEFNAFYMERFKNKVIHEKSKFIKEDGHWVYLGPVQ